RLADSLGRPGLSPVITHVSCFGWAGSIGYPPLGILTSMCQNLPMRNDPDPIDDLALALLYLTTFGPSAASTWKNLDPEVRQRLVEKRYLRKPQGKAPAAMLTARGWARPGCVPNASGISETRTIGLDKRPHGSDGSGVKVCWVI